MSERTVPIITGRGQWLIITFKLNWSGGWMIDGRMQKILNKFSLP